MTLELWFIVGAWVVMVCCFVGCHVIAKHEAKKPAPGTLEDDKVAYMLVKQRAMGKRLRKQGRSLLSGKDYTPELTKKADAPEPAPSLYAIRGGKR